MRRLFRRQPLPQISAHSPLAIVGDGEHLVQVGMRAAIRDVQDWVDSNRSPAPKEGVAVDAEDLRAYLLAMLVVAGGYEDSPEDGEG